MSIRIISEQSQILVVDIQEKLAPHLHNVEEMVQRCVQVLKGAGLFDVPITVAEQYSKGLGKSVAAIMPFVINNVFEKTTFSCFGSTQLSKQVAQIKNDGRGTLIIIGCEAHVCVLQTVIDAIDQEYRVIVVGDAVGSRNSKDLDLARSRLINAGVEYVSTEMLLFEWTQSKEASQFKVISQMLK